MFEVSFFILKNVNGGGYKNSSLVNQTNSNHSYNLND